jgi:hypothetical protein
MTNSICLPILLNLPCLWQGDRNHTTLVLRKIECRFCHFLPDIFAPKENRVRWIFIMKGDISAMRHICTKFLKKILSYKYIPFGQTHGAQFHWLRYKKTQQALHSATDCSPLFQPRWCCTFLLCKLVSCFRIVPLNPCLSTCHVRRKELMGVWKVPSSFLHTITQSPVVEVWIRL